MAAGVNLLSSLFEQKWLVLVSMKTDKKIRKNKKYFWSLAFSGSLDFYSSPKAAAICSDPNQPASSELCSTTHPAGCSNNVQWLVLTFQLYRRFLVCVFFPLKILKHKQNHQLHVTLGIRNMQKYMSEVRQQHRYISSFISRSDNTIQWFFGNKRKNPLLEARPKSRTEDVSDTLPAKTPNSPTPVIKSCIISPLTLGGIRKALLL